MGKASDLEREIDAIEEAGTALRWNRPDLRLKPDAVVNVNEATLLGLVEWLETSSARSVSLIRDGEAKAVVVPLDHYVDLVATQLERSGRIQGHADGSVSPDGLAASDVEQIDPMARWNTRPGVQG